MPTNILSIQPRQVDFRTQANADWMDTLVVWQAAYGAVLAGHGNAGNGTLTVSGVAPSTMLGPHLVTISQAAPVALFSVTDPSGAITGQGAAGLVAFAGGISFSLSAGGTAFAVGDTFAIGVLPQPIDITGIKFDLQVRDSAISPVVDFAASSRPADGGTPTIVAGTSGGQVAMAVRQPRMQQLPAGSYVYDIIASADGVMLPAFYGALTHVDGAGLL